VLEAETGDRHQRFLARRVRVLDDCERAQRGVRRMQPSAAALAAAGAVALTGLEALRRQRSARPVRAAAGESRSRDAAATGPVRMPVTLADSRAQSR
jgi:DNA-directed RNA polymerase beta' subunit